MKEGWKKRKLGEVSKVVAGQSPKSKFYNYEGIGLPFHQGKKNFSEKYLTPSLVSTSHITKEAYHGDIVMSVRAPVGPVNIVEEEKICIGRGLAAIRTCEEIDRDFLFYGLQERQDELVGRDGAVFNSINKSQIESLEFIIPSFQEQKRIVGILHEAFAGIDQAIANTKKNLENAKELFDSYLNNIFTQNGDDWEEMKLDAVSKVFTRGRSKHRPRNDKRLFGGDYPFIQTGQVRNSFHFIDDFSQTYNDTGLAQSKLWPQGTVCITIAANIAETGILTMDACFPDSIIGLVPDEQFTLSEYVEYMLQYFSAMLKREGQGSAQDNINMGTFKDMLFPFPPLKKQQSIVTQLNDLHRSTNELSKRYETKAKHLEELKQSILQKAFNGEF